MDLTRLSARSWSQNASGGKGTPGIVNVGERVKVSEATRSSARNHLLALSNPLLPLQWFRHLLS